MGESEAATHLGDLYFYGHGVDTDYEQSYYWFSKAAQSNNAYAQYSIAFMYIKGQFVEKDDTRLKDGQNISVMTTYTAREGESDLIALRMSQHQLEQNIGAVQPGTLGDFCWLDLNGNGLQDAGELGLGDMRIELWRNDQLVAETTTDAYGYYTFENLYPGVYTLKPIYPAEVVPTRMRTDIPLIASILGENGESNPVQVTSASTTYTADLGFVLVDDDVLPANYGIGEKQDWTKK